jgi:succinate dehydrogenase / fumarate reductase flavoprotein subunit
METADRDDEIGIVSPRDQQAHFAFQRHEQHARTEQRGEEPPPALVEFDRTDEADLQLAAVMLRDCTIERDNAVLDGVIAKVDELEERWANVGVPDTGGRANQSAQFVRHLKNMIVVARVIAQGARNRDESRGAHYKPEFPQRDDASWLRTTLAFHDEGPKTSVVRYERGFSYPLLGKSIAVTDDVDISLVKPRARKYEAAGAASAAAAGEAGPKSQKPKTTTPASSAG